ncbi:hypothetical protein IV52_GL000183 [Fructilactobacillus lindneri DSM 20690 = JCM 11027]|uniref:Uncharacterized protein n=2 Tax=Fructilactobacillus lindneri TaxID=53444 RepID=A0A0R2JSJ2_9LACO|nr:hypothetical protein [Fructilactobacillus lindneri]KRN80065.1 hypothetical protein IV52_GL000183 [Fructilactobacillus lindneri DSM 20690 = JCM 11027]SJZ99431.1 hypothetical protein SAMN02746042_01090 [Fructilactobacillus lindneri DSM 20690 = JCM 11027]
MSNELQGTSLKRSVVSYAGVPVQSSRLQLDFKSIIPALSLFLLVLLSGIMLISQSILQPVYWISCLLLSSFIGTNFTTLITKQSFEWSSTLILISILGLYGGIELLLLAFSFRSWNNDSLTWLKTSLQSFSKLNSLILLAFIIIISSCSLCDLPSLPLVAVTVVVTLLFFNLLLPIILATTIKLTNVINHKQKSTDKKELI